MMDERNLHLIDERNVLGKRFRTFYDGDFYNPFFLAIDIGYQLGIPDVTKALVVIDRDEDFRDECYERTWVTPEGRARGNFLTMLGVLHVCHTLNSSKAREFKSEFWKIVREIRTDEFKTKYINRLKAELKREKRRYFGNLMWKFALNEQRFF